MGLSMSEREMLERAAAAAGYKGRVGTDFQGQMAFCIHAEDRSFMRHWNPRRDSADAMELVALLRINIEHAETMSRKPHSVNCWPVGRGDCGRMEDDIADYEDAIRLAITRAAAALAPTAQGE